MSEQGKYSAAKPSPASEPIPSTSKSVSNLTRIQRNVAEKQRRDKLNGYISELATIVPMVSMSSKRLDKTSILRLSAAHLRLSKSPLSGSKKLKKSFKWCPNFLTAEQVRDILESVDGFLIVTSSSGKILFTSGSVERYLGHQNIDMIGHSLFMFIHPEDLDSVKEEIERLLTASLKSGDSGPGPRCSFRCRMKEKGQPRSEVATYQYVHFNGNMTIFDDEDGSDKISRNTAIVTHLFKAFVRIVDANPYCQLSLEDATADEYITRHTLDGTIIFADHRLSTITGHLPQEVTGLSAYKYILPEDISIALFAHHLMFSSDKGTGMIVYRLRTRDDKYVYLKSVGSLQFDRATSQVDHFVCVNQHLSDAEGEAQLKYFTERFVPHIQDNSTLTLLESVKALQVTGLPPINIGGIKEMLSYNRLSNLNTSKLSKQYPDISDNLLNNQASNYTQPSTYPVNSSESISKSVLTSQISSPLKVFTAENGDTEANMSELQCKTKKDIIDVSEKRRVNGNVLISSIHPKPVVKTINSIVIPSTSNYKTTHLPQPIVVQNSNESPLKLSNGLHVKPSALQNVNIKKELLCVGNEEHKNAKKSIENKVLLHENHVGDYTSKCRSMLKHTGCQTVNNSNSEQIHISEIPLAANLKVDSLEVSSASNMMHNTLAHSPKKKYVKIPTDSSMLDTSNIYSINAENFSDVKSNIMLSTGSVIGESRKFITIEKNALSTNKVNSSNSNQVASNVNEVVLETKLYPIEASSELNASNTLCAETFVSPMDCDDHNVPFLPTEEIKDYLESTDDISSILNSTLPFEDSSLPSVDGWSEYLRTEDVLLPPNMDVHVDEEQSLTNDFEEKSFGMW